MISFFIPCVPFKTTHHAKRIVRAGRFLRLADKPELTAAINTYESLLMPHRPREPLQGAIRLELTFYFPFNKSHPRKFKFGSPPHTTKPDCSNLAKTMEDCLARLGFFTNDSRVFELLVSKYYYEVPGIRVSIAAL